MFVCLCVSVHVYVYVGMFISNEYIICIYMCASVCTVFVVVYQPIVIFLPIHVSVFCLSICASICSSIIYSRYFLGYLLFFRSVYLHTFALRQASLLVMRDSRRESPLPHGIKEEFCQDLMHAATWQRQYEHEGRRWFSGTAAIIELGVEGRGSVCDQVWVTWPVHLGSN